MNTGGLSIAALIEMVRTTRDEAAWLEIIRRGQQSPAALDEIHAALMKLPAGEAYARMSLAGALGRIGEPASIPYLVEMLAADEVTATTAFRALRTIGGEGATIAEAWIQRDAGKPEAWQALRPRLLAMRRGIQGRA